MRDLDAKHHPFPTRRVELGEGLIVPGLLPGRELRVFMVGVDEHALRVEYEITPPVGNNTNNTIDWLLAGRDDQGNRYDDGGGADGLTPDGQRIEGVRSLNSPLSPSASWIEIAFYRSGAFAITADPNGDIDYAMYVDKAFEHAAYILRIDCPLTLA